MRLPQPTPTEIGPAGDVARMLARLYGTALQPADGTLAAAEFLALGGALADGRETNLAAIAEAFADTATALLTELERRYGLLPRPDLRDAARQTRLLAKVRAARAGSPQDILRAVRVYDTTATLRENAPRDVEQAHDHGSARGNDRGVYQFVIKLAQAVWDDVTVREEIRRLVAQMKPAHTDFDLAVNTTFRFNDPDSLFGRDAFGR